LALAGASRPEPGAQRALEKALEDALHSVGPPATAAPLPFHAAARALGETALRYPPPPESLQRATARLNEAARASAVPFFAEVDVLGTRDRPWFAFRTYRIERVTALPGDATAQALWLERLDGSNVVVSRLGWKASDVSYAVIALDMVRWHWRTSWVRRLRANAPSAAMVQATLHQVLLAQASPEEVAAYWSCVFNVQPAVVDVSGPSCEDRAHAFEPKVVAALADAVAIHELQHVIDAARGAEPLTVGTLARFSRSSDAALRLIQQERSAYLAAIAGSAWPHLALAQLFEAAAVRGYAPESVAARFVERALVELAGTAEALRASTAVELRGWAESLAQCP
jgi:hypothetical protein